MASLVRKIKASVISLAALSCVILATSACARATPTQAVRTGTVKGTVFDPNDAVVPGAKVIFESGGERRQAATDDEGRFEVDLPRGTYDVAAGAPGFCWSRRPQFSVEAGTTRLINVSLKVGAIADVIHLNAKTGGSSQEDVMVDPATQAPCGFNASALPVAAAFVQRRSPRRGSQSAVTSARTVTVSTQPNAIVWVDEVRRGTTDAGGKLQLKLTPGAHSLRVRAGGFAERTLSLLPSQRGTLNVVLTKTTDEAVLAFQQAEEARDKGNAQQAAELYRQALKLRPHFAAAHLGLARALEASEDFDGALQEVEAARRDRPVYAEASAVEGRLLRSEADAEGALAAYRRAIREARGFQPEAYTGMGIVYEDKGRYEDAVAAFRKAIAQLSDTEPILYELLGRDLEKLERWKEAVAAYEKYLELAPNGPQASAINSIIDQLRKQAAESGQQTPPD
jgi:cytochrome c-type biogenesis protein CcmH/NrfG